LRVSRIIARFNPRTGRQCTFYPGRDIAG
jgi:hypothetical protein